MLRVPGVAGAASEPPVAHGECAEVEFGDEDGSGGVEALDHSGVLVDDLMLEATGSPGGGITLSGEQVLGSPGQAVERAAIFAGGDFAVGFACLCEGALLGEIDDEVQYRVVALEAREVHLGEVERRNFAAADKAGQLGNGIEGDVLKISGHGGHGVAV